MFCKPKSGEGGEEGGEEAVIFDFQRFFHFSTDGVIPFDLLKLCRHMNFIHFKLHKGELSGKDFLEGLKE